MSDIDLTAAIEAAAEARWSKGGMARRGLHWEDTPELFRDRVRATVCVDDITAALPHVERQVREQVAREIEADMTHDANRNATLAKAARIARGES